MMYLVCFQIIITTYNYVFHIISPIALCSLRTEQSSQCASFLIFLKNFDFVTKYKFNKDIIVLIQTIKK